ncbi:MAG: NYN domain protein [Chlorobi bacterium OLB5]|nr:MAG: NYN domain protein [Chlorobi bacterium OLB5]
MKKVAILIDGGFFSYKYKDKKGTHARATDVEAFTKTCLKPDEELFRIFYYDCPYYEKTLKLPVSKTNEDYSNKPKTNAVKIFLSEIAKLDHFALRKGVLSFDGWTIKKSVQESIAVTPRTLLDSDFEPIFKQKEVDIKIGLDVAWLALNKIVDRIILIACDSDFIPVLKFARREGLQTILVTLNHTHIKNNMQDHCDEFRLVEIT